MQGSFCDLRVTVGGSSIPVDVIEFPGGEPHIKPDWATFLRPQTEATISIRARTTFDFMAALCLTDAMRRHGMRNLSLFCPYAPGARQDRAEKHGALTARVYADLINAQKYDRVTIVDPHSDVISALIERCRVISQQEIARGAWFNQFDGYIAPDAGSVKKVEAAGLAMDKPVLHARKHRDPKTGLLSAFTLDRLPKAGHYLVLDDICDGGGTFVGLAEQFAADPLSRDSKLSLFVTHGIFSQGVARLHEGYNQVATTDSFFPRRGLRTDNGIDYFIQLGDGERGWQNNGA